MSHCDGCDGGGKDLRFHDRVITRIRQSVNASCLVAGRNPVYVDKANTGGQDGSQQHPFRTVTQGARRVVPGGTLIIRNGDYFERLLESRPMQIQSADGPVRIGP